MIKRRILTYMALAACFSGGMNGVFSRETGGLEGEEPTFSSHIQPLFARYCLSCHSNDRERGGVNLELYNENSSLLEDRLIWEKVLDMLETREMPPENKEQPSEAERLLARHFIEAELAKLDCSGPISPGKVTLRRLNRSEYNNTIRDLVGVDFQPAADFPLDEVGYGFDNIGDVLSLPPLLMEKYLEAAEQIAGKAIRTAGHPEEALPETHTRLLFKTPQSDEEFLECATEVLGELARRAYRRPVTEEEVGRLVEFVEMVKEDEGSFEEGIQLALQAVLVSPHFLFRWELDSAGEGEGGVEWLSDFELASRLSYFIWSSMPDEELFSLAETGGLREEKILEEQVTRMLLDSRAKALVENFAGQWLQIRNVDTISPDPGLFPEFDEALRVAMKRETELFFEAIMREGRSILEFLDADFTYVNERLARHYGIEGIEGEEFQRVKLDPTTERGGILTQASVLAITSNPNRTSAVNRGKWILEQILGTPPPPPPPDVDELEEDEHEMRNASLRQRLEQHRAKMECATCHNRMDPLGFAFENFDAVGAWREMDGAFPVDASGVLPSGQAFNGPGELKAILKTHDGFIRTVTEKMLTFALGRGLEYYDKCTVDAVGHELERSSHAFPVLISEIVKSEPFRKKQVGGE